MHLNSLTPMRISGTPRSFLNLDSRCLTSIEAVVFGGDLDGPLPISRVGFVSMEHVVLIVSCRLDAPGERRRKVCGSAALQRLLGSPATSLRRREH